MKKIKLSLTVASTLFLINPLSAIEMTDYKIIEGSYQEAYINGKLTVEDGNQDQTSYNAHADASFKTIHTSAPYSWGLNGNVNSDFTKGSTKGDKSEDSYDSYLGGNVDKYIHNDDTIFVYGSGDLGYRKQVTADKADDLFSKVGVGAGYGRMYDATPLAIAIRIVEDLKSYKIIKKPVSDAGMIALAKVIDLKEEYISKHGLNDYKKYWYSDMEKALKSSGAIDDGVGTFGIVRINEIIDLEKISGRFHGWQVRGGLGQILSNYDGTSGATSADAKFDYGYPIGYQSQFRETATLSKILDDNQAIDFQLRNTATYTYELSDRIDWENSWNITLDKYNEGDSVVNNSISTGFRYYLANRLTFDTTLSLTKTDGTNGNSVETPDWSTKFFTGVRYRLK